MADIAILLDTEALLTVVAGATELLTVKISWASRFSRPDVHL
jgi:hypothetical protein